MENEIKPPKFSIHDQVFFSNEDGKDFGNGVVVGIQKSKETYYYYIVLEKLCKTLNKCVSHSSNAPYEIFERTVYKTKDEMLVDIISKIQAEATGKINKFYEMFSEEYK